MAEADHFKQIFELETYYITFCFLQELILKGVIFPQYLDLPKYAAGHTKCGCLPASGQLHGAEVSMPSVQSCSVELRHGHPYPGDVCGPASSRTRAQTAVEVAGEVVLWGGESRLWRSGLRKGNSLCRLLGVTVGF